MPNDTFDMPERYSLPTTPESWIRYYESKRSALLLDIASLRCLLKTPTELKGIALLEAEAAKMQVEAEKWRAKLVIVQESA